MERGARAASIQTASHGTRSQEHRNTRQGKGCREEGEAIKRGTGGHIVLLSPKVTLAYNYPRSRKGHRSALKERETSNVSHIPCFVVSTP